MEELVVLPNAHHDIEIEEEQEHYGEEEAYIAYVLPEATCFSCLGTHSKFIADSIEATIIKAVLQLNDRMKFSSYF